jgi:hypothetical protein
MLGGEHRRERANARADLGQEVRRFPALRHLQSQIVTIEELREWRNRGIAFEVREAETGEDVSRILLA